MARIMKLPTKREYNESGEEEEVTSKKAKREEEARSDDEIMPDNFAEEDHGTDSDSDSDDEMMSEKEDHNTDSDSGEAEEEEKAKKEDIVREYQIFFRSIGDPDRAINIISSKTKKEADKFFSKYEMEIFWQWYWANEWHMRRPTPASLTLTDYQRLVIYPSEEHPFYRYVDLHYPYDFDCQYQKFAEELNETIQEDFVPALKVIIEEKGLECYPSKKVFIEDALKNEEGRRWPGRLKSKYDQVKRHIRCSINIQRGSICR